MRRTMRLTLLASAASLAVAGPVFAQAGPGGSGTVEELVVTANKRSENIQDVPMAISAVSEERLERSGATNFSEYLTQIPGVNYNASTQGAGTLTVRGINAGGVAATVGTYVDETPYGSSSALVNASVLAADINPFDMQRVEVLKGPQGTLYGAGALGGVVKYVTNPPELGRYAAGVEAGVRAVDGGSTGWEAKGVTNVPIGERLAVRVTGYYEDRPGYIDDPAAGDDDINTSKAYGGRVSALFEPADALSIRLTALAHDIRADAASAVDIFRPTAADDIRPLFGDLTYSDAVPKGRQPRTRIDYRVYNATVNWDLGWAELVSALSYSTLDSLQVLDYATFANLGVLLDNRVRQDKATQEVRLASPEGQRLEWQIGVYHTREGGNLHQVLVNPVTGAAPLDQLLPSVYEETAVFGQATYNFSPQFDVTVGLRHAEDTQTGGQFGQAFGGAFARQGGSKEDATTYSFAPRWRPNADTTVYGRIASGYLAGGPNVIDVINTPANTPRDFGPAKLTNYELGVKQTLLNGRLAYDVAVYHIDWEKIQLLGVVNGVALTTNGGTAKSEGVEWSIAFLPVEGLTLGWDGSFSKAELTADAPAVVGALKGDPLPRAPDLITALRADYEWTGFGGHQMFAGATFQYIDEQSGGFITRFPFRSFTLPSYSTLNLRAGVVLDRFTLRGFVNNVTDERGYTTIGQHFSRLGGAGAPLDQGYAAGVIAPRTIGLSVSAAF